MASCTCDYSLQNTGTPGCEPLQKYTTGVILVPYADSTGVLNKIVSTVTVDSAYVTAKLNDADASKRWYPLMNVKNASSEKGDNVVETFEDQSVFIITEGVRSDSFILAAKSPVLVGKLNSFQCEEMGVYYIDKGGNVIGMTDENGDLLPIKIQKGTLSAVYTFPTATTVAKITVKYQFEVDELDENLRMFTNTATWSTVNGLMDVNAVYTAPSTTTFVATLTYDYGYANSKNPVIGLVAGDFTLYNVTDVASVTITTVVESTTVAGEYLFTFPLQTSADVLRLSGSKNGFDFNRIDDTTILVP